MWHVHFIETEILCPSSFVCPITCLQGYKPDSHGCPTCSCHVATGSTRFTDRNAVIQCIDMNCKILLFFFIEQASTSPSALKCENRFSCPSKCETAYVAGSDGCPQCACVPGACLIMRTWNQKWMEHA